MLLYNTLKIPFSYRVVRQSWLNDERLKGKWIVGHLQLAVTNRLCDQTHPKFIGYFFQSARTIIIVVKVAEGSTLRRILAASQSR